MPIPKATPSSRGGELLLAAVDRDYEGIQLVAARNLEMHNTTISHLIAGRRKPSLQMAVYLERVFDIPCPAWLEPPFVAA